MQIDVGRFVLVDSVGPARVVSAGRSGYEVECFFSPWRKKNFPVARNQLSRLRLMIQTRVYVKMEGKWKIGRIVLEHQRDDGGINYDIQFPNHMECRCGEEEIYCRCWLPSEDPTATLAIGAMETQFWHDRRQRFTDILMAQRTASRGLSALISSRIELIPHQIEVARRILEDPLQRYLLADEVGMGKTIEAGLVIRQFLLSHSTGSVLVVVPENIVRQWQLELEEKFIVSQFKDRVQVISTATFDTVTSIDVSLLVVDEAHTLIVDSISDKLERLALKSPNLLLLSATPSLGNPEILLKLLQLIDPDCYSAVTTEEFSIRVAKREELGVFLRGLRSDASPAILRQRMRRIPELLPEDKEAMALATRISEALASDANEELRKAINELRAHVADVHRIHQRLVRTRRRDAADWVFTPRGATRPGDAIDLDHLSVRKVNDPRFAAVIDIFEQWRVEMASRASRETHLDRQVIPYIISLFEALGCGIECFLRMLKGVPEDLLDQEWREAFHTALYGTEVHSTRAEQIAAELQQYTYQLQDRCRDRSPRLVVFGSDRKDVEKCAAALADTMGTNNVYCRSANSQSITEFLLSDNFSSYFCALFCCREEEEGLNLHMFDAVVHLDLPFSPTRMEQRIGRLDRFGRKSDYVHELILLPAVNRELSLWEAWYDVLAQGFRVFSEPVADVQFALEGLASELAHRLFVEGAAGLRGAIPFCQDSLASERDRLDDQYALDRVFQEEESASGLFEALDEMDASENEIAEATKGWAVDALQLSCHGDFKKVFRLEWDVQRALMPVLPWGAIFKDGLRGNLTFRRRYALNPPSGSSRPQLLRTGCSLFCAMESKYRWDDRGTAFATWRQVTDPQQEEWMAFKLSYIVECRLPEGLTPDEERSLRPRADGYLAPWSEVLFVDVNLHFVEDVDKLECLATPYEKGRDYNLGSRPEALFRLIDQVQFEKVCHTVRASSEAWIRETTAFKEKLAESIERGQLDIHKRIRRLTARRDVRTVSGELEDTGLSRAIKINEMMSEAIHNPLVKLDAIGVIVLSGRTPDDLA